MMFKLFIPILATILVLEAASFSKGADQTHRRIRHGARMTKWIPVRPSGASGGLIALTLRDQTGKLQISTISADGTNRKQLTFEGDNGRPDWSPDGRRIAFGSNRNGMVWVAVMGADGSNQKLLAEGDAPDWSPDGKQIAFSRPDRQIWVMNPDGSNLRRITQSNTFKAGPSWSPDGKEMVFILIKNPGSPTSPQPEIGIVNSDGTNEGILTTEDRMNIRVEPNGDTTVCETAYDANAPAWSPVDNRIAFWSGIESQYGQIWVINADGIGSRQLTEDCGHRNSDDPSWSPDGKKILFSTGRSGRNELWVMDADGNNEKRLSDIDAGPFPGRATWQLSDPGDTESPAVSDPTLSKKKVKRKIDPAVTITWTSSDNTAVDSHDILFAEDGVTFSTTVIAGLAGNEQSFTWTVPDSLPKTGTGRIKIIARDADGNAGEAVSGKLKIK